MTEIIINDFVLFKRKEKTFTVLLTFFFLTERLSTIVQSCAKNNFE